MTNMPDAVLKDKEMFLLAPDKIVVREGWNPRKTFETQDDEDFKQFVINNGPKFPPIFVRRSADKVELIDGERRLNATRAAIESGCAIDGIPAIFVDKNANDIEQLSLALSSNQGKPLTPTEEANACKRLKDWGLEEAEIAKRIGKSLSHVKNRLVLSCASPAITSAVEEGTITQGEALEAVKSSDGSIDKQNAQLQKLKKPAANAGKRAPKMMARLKVEKQIEELIKQAGDNGIKPSEMGNADIVGILVGMTMVLKNMAKEEAESEVFILFSENAEAEAVSEGKAPWEI